MRSHSLFVQIVLAAGLGSALVGSGGAGLGAAARLAAQEAPAGQTEETAAETAEAVEEAEEMMEAASGGAAETAAEDDPRAAVIAADQALAAAVAAGEPETFAALLAEDAVFLGGAGILRGRDAVVEGWAPLMAEDRAVELTWAPSGVRMAASGDLAYTIGDFALTALTGSEQEEEQTSEGRYLSVWSKQEDGVWRVVADGPLRRDRAFYLEQALERQGLLGPGTGAIFAFHPERTVEASSEDLSYTLGTYQATRIAPDRSEEPLATGGWLAVWAVDPEQAEEGYLPGGDSVTPPQVQ
ncbi:MAG: nuclear transport factor 2 family protein [Acidobacteriota bacterium]|jgi:uncharacterized protein (TIGR02246 family)